MTITRRITVAFGVVASLAGTVAALSCQGAPLTLEDISPHVSPNTPIIWDVPGNLLPKDLWTYKKAPQVFSESIISNAIVLASFQAKGFPKPSTNEIVIFMDPTKWEPEPPYFMILPDSGQMSFTFNPRMSKPFLNGRQRDFARYTGHGMAVTQSFRTSHATANVGLFHLVFNQTIARGAGKSPHLRFWVFLRHKLFQQICQFVRHRHGTETSSFPLFKRFKYDGFCGQVNPSRR